MDKTRAWSAFLFALFVMWLVLGIKYMLGNDLLLAAVYLCTAFILLFMSLFSKLGKKK